MKKCVPEITCQDWVTVIHWSFRDSVMKASIPKMTSSKTRIGQSSEVRLLLHVRCCLECVIVLLELKSPLSAPFS